MVDNYRVQYAYFVDARPRVQGRDGTKSTTPRGFTRRKTRRSRRRTRTRLLAVGADLRAEPLVLTVPPIEKDRYYSLQFVDGYTYNFDYVGSRTTGNGGGSYLLAGPNWKGEKPEGVNEVIRSETELAFVLYRTQLFSPSDLDNVKKIQAGYKVTAAVGVSQPARARALRRRSTSSAADAGAAEDLAAVLRRSSNFVLQFCADAARREGEHAGAVRRIGIGAGKTSTPTSSPRDAKAVEDGMADAWAEFDTFKKEKVDTGQVSVRRHSSARGGSEGQLPLPHGGRGARDLRQHRSGGAVPGVLQRLRRCAADRCEQIHVPLRDGSAAAGQRVLVADDVRVAAEPAGRQPDQPLSAQLADAAQPGAGPGRRLHASTSRTSRPARTRRPTGCRRQRGRSSWCCGCTGPSPTRSTAPGRRRSPKGSDRRFASRGSRGRGGADSARTRRPARRRRSCPAPRSCRPRRRRAARGMRRTRRSRRPRRSSR